MSLLAITNAGVLYKDAVFAGEEVQNITRVIFRNIAGLVPETAIDLAQGVPSTDIVHTNPIERVAALDGNTVVMSTVLGYDIGDFQYNWYGVIAQKADLSEVLIAVVQTPVQTKTKTEGATTGNYSTKSIVWKTANIGMTLNVTLSALPWQMADNTFVTQAAYDLAMAEKSPKNHNHDNAYLGKTAKASDSNKLEGDTKAQVITEARSGLAIGNHSHDLSYLDKGHWPTIANHTDAAHDIIFKTGKIIDSTAQIGIALGSDMVKRLDGTWSAGSGNGGLFSGSIAANTTYHCYVITKADSTVDAGFSTSATASNIPNGYIAYRRIGSILTDGSANIFQFWQRGDYFGLATKVIDLMLTSYTNPKKEIQRMTVPTGLDCVTVDLDTMYIQNMSGASMWLGTTMDSGEFGGVFPLANHTFSLLDQRDHMYTQCNNLHIHADNSGSIAYRGVASGGFKRFMMGTRGWTDYRTQ